MHETGTVSLGHFNGEKNRYAFSCHHERRAIKACGGCYARLSLAIDEAMDLMDVGLNVQAMAVLQATVDQRRDESPAFANVPAKAVTP